METNNQGTYKREVGKIELRDYDLSFVIKKALIEKGYDLIATRVTDGLNTPIGEDITIYKTEIIV